MGQEEVLKAIEKLRFTTLSELHEELGLTIPSISNSLSRLIKWKEIEFISMDQKRRIYISRTLVEELSDICENEREQIHCDKC